MDRGLVETAAQAEAPDDRRIYGVAVARVVKNCDDTNLGRVQVRLPWLPGLEPWARIAVLDRGAYFIPQVGDEVLVAFNHGDVEEAYVVGQLWNGRDLPPAQTSGDPINKRIIRTPLGHEIVFDDAARTVTIKSADSQRVSLAPKMIEIATGNETPTTVTLDSSGNITIKATSSITLDAPTINVTGTNVTVGGRSSARIDGGGYCSIQAAKIDIG